MVIKEQWRVWLEPQQKQFGVRSIGYMGEKLGNDLQLGQETLPPLFHLNKS